MERDYSVQWEFWPSLVPFDLVIKVIEWRANLQGELLLGINLS
jgi:hypothetical protein